jgi:DNA-binding MarR family transcriptional regulator
MDPRHKSDHEARFRKMFSRGFSPEEQSTIELMRTLHIANRLIDNFAERNTAKYHLSTAQMRILYWLKMHEDEAIDGGLLPSELSKFQGVTPNTVSSLLNHLRVAGLIEQVNHPDDRRKRIIKITQSGRDLLSQMEPDHMNSLRDMFSGLSHEERQILVTLLWKLIQSVKTRMECENENEPKAEPEG